jgi:hypothetical protein
MPSTCNIDSFAISDIVRLYTIYILMISSTYFYDCWFSCESSPHGLRPNLAVICAFVDMVFLCNNYLGLSIFL